MYVCMCTCILVVTAKSTDPGHLIYAGTNSIFIQLMQFSET